MAVGTVSSSREGLPSVSVVASVGVGIIVGFGVVPVAAVVSVGRREGVIFRGRGVCMKGLD